MNWCAFFIEHTEQNGFYCLGCIFNDLNALWGDLKKRCRRAITRTWQEFLCNPKYRSIHSKCVSAGRCFACMDATRAEKKRKNKKMYRNEMDKKIKVFLMVLFEEWMRRVARGLDGFCRLPGHNKRGFLLHMPNFHAIARSSLCSMRHIRRSVWSA